VNFLQGVNSLVLFCLAEVKSISRLGRAYPWEKPKACPCCGSTRLWWHGFVFVYFSCLKKGVEIRRARCPNCRSVHRLKPAGYWGYFRSSIKEITSTIHRRIFKKRWDSNLPRPRQRQWWRRFKKQTLAHLGIKSLDSLWGAFFKLLDKGRIPVSQII
jgi:hypothetical protein